MTAKTDIPKDYRPVLRTIPIWPQDDDRVGYRHDGEAEAVTVRAYENGMFSLHNCTRHAYVMGMRLD